MWMKEAHEGAKCKWQDRSAMDIPRRSCSKLVTTMCFLADGEAARGAAGLLLEADGLLSEVDSFTGKIDEGIAALVMNSMIDVSDSIGIMGVRGHWVYKHSSVWHVRSWSKEHGV